MTTTINKHISTIEGLEVWFEAEQEHVNMRTHFIDECGWSKEDYAGLKNAKWFSAKVEIHKAGIVLATEYLGCCCYNKVSDFYKEEKGYFQDMVATGIEAAKIELPLLIARQESLLDQLEA